MVRAREVKIVRTKVEHECLADRSHVIPAGSIARREKAVFCDEWKTWYACIPCVERAIEEYR
jgi:hypothetical protein